jgi:hypothetical protein
MNERIESLAKRCIAFDVDDDGNPLPMMLVGRASIQMFAESIIHECARLTLDHQPDADYYHGWLDYRDEILRHFGIKP